MLPLLDVPDVNYAYSEIAIQDYGRPAIKHDSPHSLEESPSTGGMTTQDTATTVEIRENAYGTTPVFWWGWPDEALLGDFSEKANRVEQPHRPIENDSEYVNLYFVS